MKSFVEHIQRQLNLPLPGVEAQYKMAHAVRKNPRPFPENARKAGVMALFYEKEGEPHIVLIKRVVTNANDKHSGQISFPGGKYEEQDINMSQTALRETEEEIGVLANKIQLLGALTTLYIPVSNFLVYPFVGYLSETPQFNLQLTEVDSIIEIPFSSFHDISIRKQTDLKISSQITLNKVPYFSIDNHVIWGATAMILSELIDVVEAVSQEVG